MDPYRTPSDIKPQPAFKGKVSKYDRELDTVVVEIKYEGPNGKVCSHHQIFAHHDIPEANAHGIVYTTKAYGPSLWGGSLRFDGYLSDAIKRGYISLTADKERTKPESLLIPWSRIFSMEIIERKVDRVVFDWTNDE